MVYDITILPKLRCNNIPSTCRVILAQSPEYGSDDARVVLRIADSGSNPSWMVWLAQSVACGCDNPTVSVRITDTGRIPWIPTGVAFYLRHDHDVNLIDWVKTTQIRHPAQKITQSVSRIIPANMSLKKWLLIFEN